mgnify:CR=1 FL=1
MAWFGKKENTQYNEDYDSSDRYQINQSRSIPACICAIIAAIAGWYAGEVGLYSAGFAIFLATGNIFQDLRVRKAHKEIIRNTAYTLDTNTRAHDAIQSAQQATDLANQINERMAQVEAKQG